MENSLKSGTCPKCESQEIYSTDQGKHKILPHKFKDEISFIDRPSPIVDNFVCGNCGYAEFYVTPPDLEIVKENWELRKPQ